MIRALVTISLVFINFTIAKAESGVIDFLASTGKIYSVVAVVFVVLLGIGIYLYRMDKKLTELENQINNE